MTPHPYRDLLDETCGTVGVHAVARRVASLLDLISAQIPLPRQGQRSAVTLFGLIALRGAWFRLTDPGDLNVFAGACVVVLVLADQGRYRARPQPASAWCDGADADVAPALRVARARHRRWQRRALERTIRRLRRQLAAPRCPSGHGKLAHPLRGRALAAAASVRLPFPERLCRRRDRNARGWRGATWCPSAWVCTPRITC